MYFEARLQLASHRCYTSCFSISFGMNTYRKTGGEGVTVCARAWLWLACLGCEQTSGNSSFRAPFFVA